MDLNNRLLFNVANMELFSLKEEFVNVLGKISEEKTLTEKEKEIWEKIKNTCKPNDDFYTKEPSTSTITSIKLIVSNDCNLRCSYCYASYGSYGKKRKVMKPEEAVNLSKEIANKFPNLSAILFFGGEPLLAVDAIETICMGFKDKKVNFLMETNGTIYSERIHKLIEEYNIKVTVSIDGPEFINDVHRKYPDGRGTYTTIVTNVKKLNRNKENVGFIQATYTKQAYEKLSKTEIIEHLKNEVGIQRISVFNVVTNDKNLKVPHDDENGLDRIDDEVEKFFSDIFEEKYNYNISLNTITNSILSQRRYSYFCNAGINQITIDSDGDIWPCPLYISRGNYKIGNIYDDIYAINSGFKRISEMLQSVNKETHEDCRNCVASFWCTKCPAKSLIEKGKLIIDKEDCDKNIKLTELVLTKLFQIMRNGRFEEFLNKYKEFYSREMI